MSETRRSPAYRGRRPAYGVPMVRAVVTVPPDLLAELREAGRASGHGFAHQVRSILMAWQHARRRVEP